ncbi:hypothetical protein Q0590_24765 [Rhodocytophaga aerolata]|uniref:Sigma-70 family RNA polymerase sigma factor n=1 Tax=Rhodocytophaga aerolata TaxID=455078 RepID=A0ABT8RBN8_9BACT|nr:hypothetical protein [Rhodocytophaga aerolata]MDO1449512.1 hypothetical protein [Rhodocytophaga aerolata]
MDTVISEDLYTQLLAFTHQLLKSHKWPRGKQSDSYAKGMQVDDYVQESISQHLMNPELYDPSKGSLVNYLKYYILRRLISNDLKSSENKSTVNLSFWGAQDESDDSDWYFESLMPFVCANFDDELDYQLILAEIHTKLANDTLALLVFNLIREKGYKRREVMEEAELSENDFDNAMKRLNRILDKIAKKYNINQTL